MLIVDYVFGFCDWSLSVLCGFGFLIWVFDGLVFLVVDWCLGLV